MNTTARAICAVLVMAVAAPLSHAAPVSRDKAIRAVRKPLSNSGVDPDGWLWEVAAEWPRVGNSETVVDIACSEEAGIAVTNRGRVFVSRDAGTHWELASTAPAPTEDENAPGFRCCAITGETMLAGAYRLLIMSPDGGRTWTTGDIPPLPDEHNNRKWTIRAICPDGRNGNDMMAVADTPLLTQLQTVGTERRQIANRWVDVPVREYRTVRTPLTIVLKSADRGFNWSAAIQPGGLQIGLVGALHYERTGRSWLVGQHMDRVLLEAEETGRPIRDVWFSDNDGGTWQPLTTPTGLSRGFGSFGMAWIASFGRTFWMGRSLQYNPVSLWRTMDAGASWREMQLPGEFPRAYSMALLSTTKGVMVVFRDVYHTMDADQGSPHWVEDTLPEGWQPFSVSACKAGRYPFVAGGKKGSTVGILGAVPPRRTIVRPPRVRARGPAATRSAPRPR